MFESDKLVVAEYVSSPDRPASVDMKSEKIQHIPDILTCHNTVCRAQSSCLL